MFEQRRQSTRPEPPEPRAPTTEQLSPKTRPPTARSDADESLLQRYGPLLEEMDREIAEFARTRRLEGALRLSEASGQHFNHNEPPLYFTGDLDSDLVLIHLNPKAPSANAAATFQGPLPFRSLAEYLGLKTRFGALTYGPQAPRTHRSPFDHKQVRFLRPFGVIDFVEESTRDDRFLNLELVCDRKLQLELIPYPSPTFSVRGMTSALLGPHLDRIMRVISARQRRYVIFCGNVFAPYLRGSILEDHRFTLIKRDGLPERMTSRFATLMLQHEAKPVRAGLAYSFARQGIPMEAYGSAVYERYGRT